MDVGGGGIGASGPVAHLCLGRLTDLWVRERRDGCGDGVKFEVAI